MAMVGVDDGSLEADSQPKSVGLVWGSAAAWRSVWNSSHEPSELSQWPWHYDSTINIGISITLALVNYRPTSTC